jgi:methyl-accepting chemotaxis protein
MMNLKALTIGKKLLIFGMLGSAIPLIVFSAIVIWQDNNNEATASRECSKMATDSLDHVVRGLQAMLVSQQEVLEQKVAANLNVAANELAAAGGATLGKDNVAWQARNQVSSVEQKVELPQMLIGTEPVTPNADLKKPSPVVDKVSSLVGGACTIFQRMNEAGDMLRVVTNVETKDGKRAINTFIPSVNPDGKPNPVMLTVLKGERFVGRAFVANDWYVTAYEPIKGADGKITGMLFVGVPEKSAKSLREAFLKTEVGKTGYAYVIDPKGTYVISQKGKRDGEAIWEAKDANGSLFIQNIVKKALALKPDEIAEEHYPWKNPDDPNARMKIARFSYFGPWEWIIAAGSYEEEFNGARLSIQAANRHGKMILASVFGICILASAVIWIMLSRGIAGPIRRAADMLKDIAQGEGDLTKRLVVSSKDELGDLARWFNTFVEKIQGIVRDIKGNTITLAEASSGLSTTATQLASGAEETTNQSSQVAAAAEQMSTNMGGMSASTEEMSTNIKVMASAIEELTSSISEVAKSAERAAGVAGNAAQLVSTSNSQICDLGNAADEIGKVIEVIQDIAEQTNLLALNATIEAARAGDAGKGFAVVATEVKELAKQTATATEDIRKRIEGIQGSTGLTVKSISDISEVVKQVNDLSRTIASAVEEQSITTKEIAKNVAQSSTAAQTVARSVAESATATQEITRSIVGVDQAAKQAAQGAAKTQATGNALSLVTEQLQTAVGQFKV